MASYDYDVLVIGAGSGGSTAARLLAQGGKSVGLVESHKLGGDCPYYACIPTKALLESAHLYHKARHSDHLGLRGSTIGFNYPRVRAWKNAAIRATGADESEKSLTEEGVHVIHGSAHFLDQHTITVGQARFSAKQFIIATGAEVKVPAIAGLAREDFLTYKDALELTRPPRSIAIIGGGAAAVEFASIFGSFGSKVYIIEKSSRILNKEDALLSKVVQANLEDQYDCEAIAKAEIKSCAKRGNKKQLILKVDGGLHTIVVDDILFATGKIPATDIGLENAGVLYDKTGIGVNEKLQTSTKHIFAIGDVLGTYQFTHVALHQARLLAHNLLLPKRSLAIDYRAVPRTIFTSPECAAVGLSAQELRNLNIPSVSAIANISNLSKARTTTKTQGFVKITARKKTGQVLSASIVAPQASEMIHELSLAIQNNLTVYDIAQTIHAFPTWSDAIRAAATEIVNNL